MTTLATPDPTGFGDAGPPDVRSDDATTGPTGRPRPFWPWTPGWPATAIPVTPLLLLGLALGPLGLGVLSAELLRLVDPAVPVALAVLGALVAMRVGLHGRSARVLPGVATEVGVIVVVLAAVVTALGLFTTVPVPAPVWLVGATIGICAATSLTSLTRGDEPSHSPVSIRADTQAGVAIVAGGVALALFRGGSPFSLVSPAALMVQAIIVALVLAAAGWLLLSDATSDTERRIFVAATLLLVGGAADYLSLSALLGGLVAGVFWEAVGGQARDGIERDAQSVQRPLVALVLVVAGARTEPSLAALVLAGLYVVSRAAAAALGRKVGRLAAGSTGGSRSGLLPPGVFGVAFALNALRAVGPELGVVLTVVVLGTIGAEMAAGLVRRRGTA